MEFDLSEKIFDTDIGFAIHPDDVKEFIRLLKESFFEWIDNDEDRDSANLIIDKLAGAKL